ncbi:TPA: hypothetical protein ACMDT9_003960 [Vibrio parahaemolyticus]|uniref:hypothetical protein n=1 Tax=Vibrio parahaemolyticus TaxID=670 RepID=UPI002361EF6A|nr:hypothetical protein [Vibrio parahaemolyticus]
MFSKKFLDKDRSVQERWFRLKFNNRFGSKIRYLFRLRLHYKLNREFKVKDKTINNAIDITVREYRKIDESLFPATKQFFNIGLFFLLAERDIQALKADAFSHPNETKRNIALRTLILTIYEWDMGKVTGRKMHFIYEATGLSETSKSQVVSALKELKKARKVIESQFSETRHNTIAHREKEAIKQYEIISELNVMKFSEALTQFYKASDALLTSMIVAMLEIGSPKNLLHQAINSKKVA